MGVLAATAAARAVSLAVRVVCRAVSAASWAGVAPALAAAAIAAASWLARPWIRVCAEVMTVVFLVTSAVSADIASSSAAILFVSFSRLVLSFTRAASIRWRDERTSHLNKLTTERVPPDLRVAQV